MLAEILINNSITGGAGPDRIFGSTLGINLTPLGAVREMVTGNQGISEKNIKGWRIVV